MKYFCCDAFDRAIENAGKSGLAFLCKSEGNRGFRVQSRGVDFELEEQAAKYPIAINLATEQVIKICPFCGCDLRSYVETSSTFNDLGAEHELYLLSR